MSNRKPRGARYDALAVALLALATACGGGPAPVEIPEGLATDPNVSRLLAEKRAAAAATPGDAGAHLDLGLALAANEAWELATESFENALSIDGSDVEANYQLARAAARRGDAEEQISLLRRALEIDGDLLAARCDLGWALLDGGDLDGARTEFKTLALRLPDLFVGDLGLGLVAMEAGDLETGLKHLTAAREMAPDNGYVRYQLGRAYAAAGREDAARALLDGGGSAGPRPTIASPGSQRATEYSVSRDAEVQRAQEMIEGGRHAESIEVLRPMFERDPTDSAVASTLAAALLKTGDLEGVREAVMAGLESDPNQPMLHLQLAQYHLFTAGKLEQQGADGEAWASKREALECAERAVDLSPRSHEVHRLHGTVLDAMQRYEESIAAYRRCVQNGGADASLYVAMVSPAMRLGGADAAAAILREGIGARVAGSIQLRFGLVTVLARDARFDEARSELAEMQRIAPRDGWTARASQELARAQR